MGLILDKTHTHERPRLKAIIGVELVAREIEKY